MPTFLTCALSLMVGLTFLLCGASALAVSAPVSSATVQRVVCPVNGPAGPLGERIAPVQIKGLSKRVAKQLTYYASDDLGVLAPSGWHCAETSHGNGSLLLVTPEPRTADALLRRNDKAHGPAVELVLRLGATSGEVYVAGLAARLFPSASGFVHKVMKQNIMPEGFFQSKPYPRDRLTRHGKYVVNYVTPSDTMGLGTYGRLARGVMPIRGAVVLLPHLMNIVKVDVRLPAALSGAASGIIRAAVADARNVGAVDAPGFSLEDLRTFVKAVGSQTGADTTQSNNEGVSATRVD